MKKHTMDIRFNIISFFVECPHGVMVKAMDCGIVVSEFVLQSRYYVHFRKVWTPLSS